MAFQTASFDRDIADKKVIHFIVRLFHFFFMKLNEWILLFVQILLKLNECKALIYKFDNKEILLISIKLSFFTFLNKSVSVCKLALIKRKHKCRTFRHLLPILNNLDNRHFYRIPKRPIALRKRWLEAIGRSEETIVSQASKFMSFCS